MPYRSKTFWYHTSWFAFGWTPFVFAAFFTLWNPLKIHNVRGVPLDNGYMLENVSSKSRFARMFCRLKPDTFVVLEDRNGIRHVEADNSTGKGTGNVERRAWQHIGDWPSNLASGPIEAWKVIQYPCLSIGLGWMVTKTVETPKVIIEKAG